MKRIIHKLQGSIVCFVLTLVSVSVIHAKPASLVEAVNEGSAYWVSYYLDQSPNLSDGIAIPLLAKAVESGDFNMARAFLQHGVNVTDFMEAYPELTTNPDALDSDALSLHYLIRAYDLMRKYGRPFSPEKFKLVSNRVIVYEPTVDYTHPEIAPNYYVNQQELAGEQGVDDDANGFVDDVYGWSPVSDGPHITTYLQVKMWEENREFIAKLFDIYNRNERGEYEGESNDYTRLDYSYTNPLTALWSMFSDMEFLDKALSLSHGSHVAGIVIEQSGQQAQIHTMSWDSFGRSAKNYFDVPVPKNGETYKEYRARMGEEDFKWLVKKGYEVSDYFRTHGISVVNASMGEGLEHLYDRIFDTLDKIAETDSAVQDDMENYIHDLMYEMFAYKMIPYVIAAAENPQILFVVAAGNADKDVDETFDLPSYLSRFFPNIITVAASNPDGGAAGFSNYGEMTVSIAAPGVGIESHGIAGTRVIMDGTSMAAPAVAGFAVALREQFPDVSPEEMRYAMELAVDPESSWEGLISSQGNLNKDATISFLKGESGALIKSLWSGVLSSEPDARPSAWLTATKALAKGVNAMPSDADLLYAYAVALDVSGDAQLSLQFMSRALALDNMNLQKWNSLMIILGNLGDHRAIVAKVDDFLKSAAYNNAPTNDFSIRIITRGVEAAERIGLTQQAASWSQLLPDTDSLAQVEAEIAGYTSVIDISPAPTGRSIEGRLSSGDQTFADGSYIDQYDLYLQRGDEFLFDLVGDFDTMLVVSTPSGRLENDDFGGEPSRSQISGVAEATGYYEIYVNSYDPGVEGDYIFQWVTKQGTSGTGSLRHSSMLKDRPDVLNVKKSSKGKSNRF